MHEFRKTKVNPIFEKLIPGMVSYEGDKWAKHRRLINPAFHIEKLKVTPLGSVYFHGKHFPENDFPPTFHFPLFDLERGGKQFFLWWQISLLKRKIILLL